MRKISLENLKITTIAQQLNGDRKLSKSQILMRCKWNFYQQEPIYKI